jgi:tRNA (cmo5U34)-methyltransferase
MNTSELRFSNKTGEEYDLFSLALPHQDRVQTKSVETMFEHFANKEQTLEILDIGFGTGITSKEILSKDRKVHLIGIDNEPAMLQKALKKLETFSSETFNLETIGALEYLKSKPDESFDAIISVWVLHNLLDSSRKEIFREIYRTLKKNGIFVNGDKIAVPDVSEHKKHFDWQIEKFDVFNKIGRPELAKEWTEHYIEDEKPERILREDVYVKDLSEIGFKKCDVIERHFLDAVSYAIK